jgi:hypothetical protein
VSPQLGIGMQSSAYCCCHKPHPSSVFTPGLAARLLMLINITSGKEPPTFEAPTVFSGELRKLLCSRTFVDIGVRRSMLGWWPASNSG